MLRTGAMLRESSGVSVALRVDRASRERPQRLAGRAYGTRSIRRAYSSFKAARHDRGNQHIAARDVSVIVADQERIEFSPYLCFAATDLDRAW